MRHLIILTLLLSTALSAGSIHKWTDENGEVHYGDAPPVAQQTDRVKVLSAPSNPGKALPRLSTQSGSSDAANKVPDDQAKLACDNARSDLKVISDSSRVKIKSPDGTTRYMTTEEIELRKTSAQADVDRFCK